jgi:hypothetical protein
MFKSKIFKNTVKTRRYICNIKAKTKILEHEAFSETNLTPIYYSCSYFLPLLPLFSFLFSEEAEYLKLNFFIVVCQLLGDIFMTLEGLISTMFLSKTAIL